MPRHAVILVLAVFGLAPTLSADDPHLDRRLLPLGCPSCHEGHGVSESPMLPKAQNEICLDCHDSQAKLDGQIRAGRLDPQAQPKLLGSVLARPFTHPLSEDGLSRNQPDVVVCASCHSPHRQSTGRGEPRREGSKKISSRNPRAFEHELCEGCHGSTSPGNPSPVDLRRLFDSTSRSSHPVRGPANEGSPSARSGLRQKLINCTDCHRPSRDGDPRGPHGSGVAWILGAAYATADGAEDPAKAYALCFECHDRDQVLSPQSPFPLHALHVESGGISCASCHNPHGSVANRALVRIGEESKIGSTSPSAKTGRLAFVSEAPGAGSCYLTCHGVDHGPASYGPGADAPAALDVMGAPTLFGTRPSDEPAKPSRPVPDRPRPRDEGPPPPR